MNDIKNEIACPTEQFYQHLPEINQWETDSIDLIQQTSNSRHQLITTLR